MDTSNVCPTEDAIKAFMELVEPLLPASRYSIRAAPLADNEREVAKQVHAVVLLYNYYHRKMHPYLEHLSFVPFCKLALVLKPNLTFYMKLMLRSDYTELSDPENELSLTEKAIMDACDISTSLDASRDVPNTKQWPVSKVAILLIDSSKKNCALQYGCITKGVWSVIEKDLPASCCSLDGSNDAKHLNKRKRIANKPLQHELDADGSRFLEVAYSAVKEATNNGINRRDLTIIESHVVYSSSKEKTATCFYIMQCIHAEKYSALSISIKDVIGRLQGPLVEKCSSLWTNSSVVEYFHLLPYVKIISQWLSSFQDQELVLEGLNKNDSIMTENPREPDGVKFEVVDSTYQSVNDHKGQNCPNAKAALSTIPSRHDGMPTGNHLEVLSKSNSNYSAKQQKAIASKGHIISETALRVLLSKRDKLVLQQRNIGDEIAECDKKIKTILNGGEDDLELKIDLIIEGCNDVGLNSASQGRTSHDYEDQYSTPCIKRNIFSEDALSKQNPCQELDGICKKNRWILPTYQVFPSNGGFQAKVSVKGMNFESSKVGDDCPKPSQARRSAARKMSAELRRMSLPSD